MINETESMAVGESSAAAPSVKQTQYSIEPIAEGPRVKPKRQLSEKQLKALEQGRKRLAETRRIKKESINTAVVLQQMEKQLQQKEKEETQAKEQKEKEEQEKVSNSVSTNSAEEEVVEEVVEEGAGAEEAVEVTESNESNESSDDELEEVDYNLWCSIS
jgi:hypothetical protein